MNFTVRHFANLTNKSEQAILKQAFRMFISAHAMGYEDQAEPILDEEQVVIDMKMTHVFGTAVISALDAVDDTDDFVFVLDQADLIRHA